MRIKLTAEEREIVEPFVAKMATAQCAFNQASVMIKAAEKELWEELLKINPDTIKINHPEDGDWEIIVRG
uniref:Uncharacterized protein n=1 Tax=viral metagenome TaxID=1070528 RepID=A0A6M3J2Q5_9ZZZZ